MHVSLDSFTNRKDLGWSGMCVGTKVWRHQYCADISGPCFEGSSCWKGVREDEMKIGLMVGTKDLLWLSDIPLLFVLSSVVSAG